MTPFQGYALGLAALLPMAVYARSWQLWLAYLVIALDWLVLSALILVTGIYEPWQLAILVDGAAAFFLLRHPSNAARAVLGATYCIEITMHVAFGMVQLRHDASSIDLYVNWITAIAYLQLSLVFGGACGGAWRRLHDNRRRHAEAVHTKNHRPGEARR